MNALRIAGLFLLTSIVAFPSGAQQSPYAGLETREIKALSQEQIDGYLEGRGMSLAMPAELNGYPGPKHVLELAEELGLTGEQAAAAERSFDAMQASAIEIGKTIVNRERQLDRMFASGEATPAEMQKLLDEIGDLQSRLRFTHLNAHLEMKSVLTPEQVKRYVELRGYAGDHSQHHGHHG